MKEVLNALGFSAITNGGTVYSKIAGDIHFRFDSIYNLLIVTTPCENPYQKIYKVNSVDHLEEIISHEL